MLMWGGGEGDSEVPPQPWKEVLRSAVVVFAKCIIAAVGTLAVLNLVFTILEGK